MNDHGSSSSHSTTTSLAIPWGALSPGKTAVLRQFGTRLAEGYSTKEIASEFGTSNSLVLARLAEAQEELCRLASPG